LLPVEPCHAFAFVGAPAAVDAAEHGLPNKLPRPRRRLTRSPPAPADPGPWQQVLGDPPLTAAEFEVLTRLARRRVVPAGAAVFAPTSKGHLVLLLCGDVVQGSRNSTGSLRTERSVTGPGWLDLSAAWLGQPYAMEAQALSDAVVAELPLAALLPELVRHPNLLQRLCVNLARQVQEQTIASRNLLHNDAPARFAQWLLQRCATDADDCELRLQERKRDIAQQLAMTPETLSRLMRSFEMRGLIEVRGYQVRVPHVSALRACAGMEEAA
jgi:CRP-like cAMP-binding protein